MADLDIDEAKRLTAGIKRLCRESSVPLTAVELTLSLVDDGGHGLTLRMHGVPPLTKTDVVLDGIWQGTFNGHEEVS